MPVPLSCHSLVAFKPLISPCSFRFIVSTNRHTQTDASKKQYFRFTVMDGLNDNNIDNNDNDDDIYNSSNNNDNCQVIGHLIICEIN